MDNEIDRKIDVTAILPAAGAPVADAVEAAGAPVADAIEAEGALVADAVEAAGAPVADAVLTEACNRAVLKLTELSNIFWTFCIKIHAINVNSNKENQINNYFGYQMWYY